MRCQDIRSTLLGVAIKLLYEVLHLQFISVKAQETHMNAHLKAAV